MKALQIKVFGRVQGVFFRASTRDKAQELAVKGWCRNEPDGSVLIWAEGEEQAMAEFLAWCHKGPRWSKVERLEQESVTSENFANFEIRRF